MFKFIRTSDPEHAPDAAEIEYRVLSNDVTWPDLVEEFMQFLRGCGYSFDIDSYDEEVERAAARLQAAADDSREAGTSPLCNE